MLSTFLSVIPNKMQADMINKCESSTFFCVSHIYIFLNRQDSTLRTAEAEYNDQLHLQQEEEYARQLQVSWLP
jgi:hypothetical protein